MKIHEIPAQPGVANGDKWFRPVSWKGRGCAYCRYSNVGINVVPSLKGGYPAVFPCFSDLEGEWEVLDPGEVLEE